MAQKTTAVQWRDDDAIPTVHWQSMKNEYTNGKKKPEEEEEKMREMKRRGIAIMKVLPRQMATLTTFFMLHRFALLCNKPQNEQNVRIWTRVETNIIAYHIIIIVIICRKYEKDAHAHTYALRKRREEKNRQTTQDRNKFITSTSCQRSHLKNLHISWMISVSAHTIFEVRGGRQKMRSPFSG